jgi:hypothetical protein
MHSKTQGFYNFFFMGLQWAILIEKKHYNPKLPTLKRMTCFYIILHGHVKSYMYNCFTITLFYMLIHLHLHSQKGHFHFIPNDMQKNIGYNLLGKNIYLFI